MKHPYTCQFCGAKGEVECAEELLYILPLAVCNACADKFSNAKPGDTMHSKIPMIKEPANVHNDL